jgi:hypothetical protein
MVPVGDKTTKSPGPRGSPRSQQTKVRDGDKCAPLERRTIPSPYSRKTLQLRVALAYPNLHSCTASLEPLPKKHPGVLPKAAVSSTPRLAATLSCSLVTLCYDLHHCGRRQLIFYLETWRCFVLPGIFLRYWSSPLRSGVTAEIASLQQHSHAQTRNSALRGRTVLMRIM